jgi:hypothetical protein
LAADMEQVVSDLELENWKQWGMGNGESSVVQTRQANSLVSGT